MTREEEIRKQASKYGEPEYLLQTPNIRGAQGFIHGAMWADAHPRKVYVVMRCEEHSDYVEKVFVDNNKAVAYCNKFNQPTSDEYCRVIEEMEVTL